MSAFSLLAGSDDEVLNLMQQFDRGRANWQKVASVRGGGETIFWEIFFSLLQHALSSSDHRSSSELSQLSQACLIRPVYYISIHCCSAVCKAAALPLECSPALYRLCCGIPSSRRTKADKQGCSPLHWT